MDQDAAAHERRRAVLLDAGANFRPRRIEKRLRPTFRARTVEVMSVHHLQPLGDVRRHQLHPERRRNGVGVADLCSVVRNQGQNNAFSTE